MAKIPARCAGYGAAALFAVGAAWLLSSPGGQARLGAHLSATLDSGDGPPGGQSGIGEWQPYSFPGGSSRRRPSPHPGSCSPNLTSLAGQRYDWQFYPPSEGDL